MRGRLWALATFCRDPISASVAQLRCWGIVKLRWKVPIFATPINHNQLPPGEEAFKQSLLLPLQVLLWQIDTHPPRREPHPLLLVHAHAGVVPLKKARVGALGAEVGDVLLGCFGVGGAGR